MLFSGVKRVKNDVDDVIERLNRAIELAKSLSGQCVPPSNEDIGIIVGAMLQAKGKLLISRVHVDDDDDFRIRQPKAIPKGIEHACIALGDALRDIQASMMVDNDQAKPDNWICCNEECKRIITQAELPYTLTIFGKDASAVLCEACVHSHQQDLDSGATVTKFHDRYLTADQQKALGRPLLQTSKRRRV